MADRRENVSLREDFRSAPLGVKIFLVVGAVYVLVIFPLVLNGYFGDGVRDGALMFFGVRP